MSTAIVRQRTTKDPYVMTDEHLTQCIASKLPTPFGKRFYRLQGMSRAKLIEEFLRYYNTTALIPEEVK